MIILLDAMGGDNAPDATIKGAVKAINDIKAEVVLIGNKDIINKKIKEFYDKDDIKEISPRLSIHHTTETIEMVDIPTHAIKHKKDSSMVVGFNMLKEGKGDVFISAGNSGALLTGATLLVGRIKGIDRPALAGILPSYKSRLLLMDCGSNTNCKPINLLQFAQMSSIYLKNTFNMDRNPTVGLLNIGTEETKGNELIKESYKLLKEKAEELKEKLIFENDEITKVEVVNGYLNFFINNLQLVKEVLKEIDEKKEKYGSSDMGKGKNVVVDYSSPNIAKPFHIGHLRSTVIGNSLYKTYKFLGYNCIGINHLGDYGTQFGKLIEGYKRWGSEYNIEENPIDELTKIYVRINNLCKEDESVLEECRSNFKKLEEKDEYCVKLWNKFRELSLKEFQRIYDLLDVHFDSLNGEAFYSDKMDEVIDILEKTGRLVESEGARVIELEEKKIPPCIIQKSNGSTTYATRDLAAILYRARNYDFDKALYLTSYEQILHFNQVFEVAKLLGLDEKYTNNLIHVPFGMIQLKSGKMSTREGNVVKLEDLLKESISRVKEIIEKKNPELEDKEKIAELVQLYLMIYIIAE